jgi:Flp pilus assembly protein TadG
VTGTTVSPPVPTVLPAALLGVRERGAVTAETAVILPALAALLVLCMWAVGAVGQQLECIDAARIGARAMARGESAASVQAAVRRAAPADADVSVRVVGALAVVRVRAVARLPGPWKTSGPGLHLGSSAVAEVEGP